MLWCAWIPGTTSHRLLPGQAPTNSGLYDVPSIKLYNYVIYVIVKGKTLLIY